MVQKCSVINCFNRKDRENDLIYYRLPFVVTNQGAYWQKLCEDRRMKWLANLNQCFKGKNIDNVRVCSAHFVGDKSAKTEPDTVKKAKTEIPDLKWQIEGDDGVWKTYGDADNTLLCDGCINEKQVTLSSGDGTTVNFARLIEKKMSGYSHRVRCGVREKGGAGYYTWSWANTTNKAQYYTADSTVDLETAKQDGIDSVNVSVGTKTHTVELEEMEYSTGTGVSRKVQRDAIDITIKCESVDSGISSSSSSSLDVKDTKSKSAAKVKKEAQVKKEVDDDIKPKSAGGKGKSAKSTGSKSVENGTGGKSGVARVVVMNGKAPVDAECVALSDKAHVFCEGKDVWDCMLNQTNVGSNNNKYYIIQILEEHSKASYHVWQRWGRVGYKGQNNLVPCGPDLNKAKSVFSKKFSDKTKNDWSDRDFFEKVPGKYDLLAMDYSPQGKDEPDAPIARQESVKAPECTLDTRLQALIQLICDVKYMEQAVIEMEYDAKKAPLGKLTESQIKAGYSALKMIADLIEKKDMGNKLTQACSDFYTRIPHNFGMRPPTTIRSEQEVKAKLQLLEALSDIEIAIKTLKEGDHSENPIDRHYKALHCGLEPMDRGCPDFKILERYLQDTHASTHSHYSMQLLDIFNCNRETEHDNFHDCGNRMLLWHGSRLTNWVGILTKGLRIAPPEAPSTGYMFGKGVYFADMSSKSANYCFASQSKNVALLLLCDVALGTPNELLTANYNAHKLPPNTHCPENCIKSHALPKDTTQRHLVMALHPLSDGVVVPSGKGVNTGITNPGGYTLHYNEYIVYNTKQIRMRYLLKVKFNFKR